MNILVTGGSGYVGHNLVKKLLSRGFRVSVIDTNWFGCWLPKHPLLTVVKKDIRDITPTDFMGMDVVIHLANIANDPAVDLNPLLSWEVNVLACHRISEYSVKAGVKQIIYASSGSVYGVKDEEKVTEDLDLVPISSYNKTKMIAERVFLSYRDKLAVHNVRPATVCGLSPRMRFDVSVNMFVSQAFRNGEITVLGGDQVRPNIHIDDLVELYEFFIENPDIPSGAYNAGFQNVSILDIARMVTDQISADIRISPSVDPRSYRLDSSKVLDLGFAPSRNVGQAIAEIKKAMEGGLADTDINHTIRWMSTLKL